jgi:hypothetical protein
MNESLVKWLQVESACDTNELDLARFEQVLKLFPRLETVEFHGHATDCTCASNLFDQINMAKKHAELVQLCTTGSGHEPAWWAKLAELISGSHHRVQFNINSVAEFILVTKNVQDFINAGGNAVWHFAPFVQDEKELQHCFNLSQQSKFKKFKLVKHPAQDLPPQLVAWADCRHLAEGSVYLNANGQISPCHYFNMHRAVDDFRLLPKIKIEIESNRPDQQCLLSCGTCATIEHHDAN